jgi:hypothetical protein
MVHISGSLDEVISGSSDVLEPDSSRLLIETSKDLGIENGQLDKILRTLNLLKGHNEATYEHSIRVGLKTANILDFLGLDPQPGIYACLHDIGKLYVPSRVLNKTDDFGYEDKKLIRIHPVKGYEFLIKEKLLASAWIALLHHTFQNDPYPSDSKIPKMPHYLGNETRNKIRDFARYVSIADQGDALKRRNGRYGPSRTSTPCGRMNLMLEINPDKEKLVVGLYEKGILD